MVCLPIGKAISQRAMVCLPIGKAIRDFLGIDMQGGGMKQTILFLFLSVLLVSFSGCNTIKGAAEGLGKDTGITWQKAKKADDWLQKHAW